MWVMAGAPLDSSGRDRGEARAPSALREAGLAEVPAIRDQGDLPTRIDDPARDAETGIIGFRDLVAASTAIADWIAAALAGPERPLVIGGDCALLPGVFAGLRRSGIAPGLWMVDGHPDALDGATSPTGEAADMDLALLLGRGPAELTELGGRVPLVEPEHVVLLGHRPPSLEPEVARELGLLPGGVARFDAPTILARGAGEIARRSVAALAGRPAWLHLDLDVLDEREFPAVTYPQPLGLDWGSLVEMLEPFGRSDTLIGVSVADLEPDRDPDGDQTRRVVSLLGGLLG